jgi:tetratricopeptide (TPR) repeat protein
MPQPAADPDSNLPRRNIRLGILSIVFGALLVYIPAMRAGFIWDDPDYVINNATLRSFNGLIEMWTQPGSLPQWYPLVHTTYWIEYHLWGLWPTGYHIDNVLLHIVSALLLWRLLRMLRVPGAWLAAAIFAVHPVQVESVAWITERKNVLSGVFYFLSLITYLQFDAARDAPVTQRRGRLYYVSLLLFVAALLSKSVVATLPATLLVIFWWKRGTIRWRDIRPLIPFFVIGIGLGLLTAYLEVHKVGARSDKIVELNLSAVQRVLIAGRAVCFYFGKLIVPWPLVFIYPQWKPIGPAIWWQWLFPIFVVVAILSLVLLRNRIGRGPAAAVMVFCGTLFPALGFLNVYPMRFSYVADHFQYHAAAAMITLLAALLCRYASQFGRIVLIPLAAITLIRTHDYHDAQTLWYATLRRNPDSWMVHTNLGKVLVERGEQTGDERFFIEAAKQYEIALGLDPNIHDTHANVATMMARKGDDAGAIAEFERALAIHPYFAPAYYGLGQVYQRQGKLDLGMEMYQKAIEISPDYPLANYSIARILEQQGDTLGAIDHYRKAVAGMPEDADARYNLGTCLLRVRLYPEAVYNLQHAVRIRPDWAQAWTNLGAGQLFSGHPQDAIASFQSALAVSPNFTPAQQGLARAQQAMRTPQ